MFEKLGDAFWDLVDTLKFTPVRARFPAVRTWFYGHGAFMGAAPALLDDPDWRRILGFLMPDVFEALQAALDDGAEANALMPMLENNPVLAAFGTVRAAEKSGEDEHPNHLAGLEWDLFVDTDLIEAHARAATRDEANDVLDRVIDTALIAHAGAIDTVQESLGFSQYHDVRRTPKTEFGGVEMDAWLDLFGRALFLARAVDLPAAIAAMSADPRVDDDQPCMLNTFASPWAVPRVVDLYGQVTGRPFLSIIIDIKSLDSTPHFLAGLVQRLNVFGVHVAAVGSFKLEEIEGVAAPDQRLGEHVLPGPREVLFFHFAGDLQAAVADGAVPRGQSVLFNGASILRFVPGETLNDYSFAPHDEIIAALEAMRRDQDLEIGFYVQEGDCEAAAATALSDIVDDHPETFVLGFAWGGLRDEAGLLSGPIPRMGYGSQLMLAFVGQAKPWELGE